VDILRGRVLMRITRYISLTGMIARVFIVAPLALCGCDGGAKEGTLVERTPEQIAGEKASMKGMMEAMKTNTKKK